jgi:Transcriptional regulator
MNGQRKRSTAVDCQKEERKEKVIVAAIEVFKAKGIENVKMTDIAEKAAIGVASVYRYFKTKPELVVAVASRFWEMGLAALTGSFDDNKPALDQDNGLQQVRRILEVTLAVYRENHDFIRFLEELDYYILKEQIGSEKLAGYEKSILNTKNYLITALEAGKRDGSIRPEVDNNRFCITITRALMSLCQKMVLRGIILPSDNEINGEDQLKMLIDMAVRFVQN